MNNKNKKLNLCMNAFSKKSNNYFNDDKKKKNAENSSSDDDDNETKNLPNETALVPITSSCASRWQPLEYADAAISTLSVSSGQPVIEDINARNSLEYNESLKAKRFGSFAASSGCVERFMFAKSCV